jgi:aminoglycoside phosphotransferase family enzyme
MARYRARTRDAPDRVLFHFYEAYRALVRARLAITHLRDHDDATAAKWRGRAAAYLAIAERRLPALERRRTFDIGQCRLLSGG